MFYKIRLLLQFLGNLGNLHW